MALHVYRVADPDVPELVNRFVRCVNEECSELGVIREVLLEAGLVDDPARACACGFYREVLTDGS